MKWSVVCDERWVDDARALGSVAAAIRPGAMLDRHFTAEGAEVLAVVGDDWTLGRVMTHFGEVRPDIATPPAILVVPRGDAAPAGDGIAKRRGSLPKLRRRLAAGDAETALVPTLRVVDSAERHALLGFNIGLGLPFDFFEARARTGRTGAVGNIDALVRLGRTTARQDLAEGDVWVDWIKRGERFRLLLASAVGRTWFGVDMSTEPEGPGLRLGKSIVEVAEARSRVGRVLSRFTGHRAEPFDRIHIDTNVGYVLDGELFDPRSPRTIAIEAGPRVRFVVH